MCLCVVDSATNVSYITYGPAIVNAKGYAALAAGYNLGYVPRNASALTISVGLSISSTTDPTLLAMDQALQFAVELVNFRGGVMVSGQQHYLSVTYAVDGGSSSQAAAIYASMLSWGNVSAYLAPSSDALLQSVSSQLNQSSAFTLAVYDTDPADYATSAPYLFSPLNTATSRWTAALTAINEQAQSYVTGVRGGSGSMNGIKTLCMLSTSDSLTQAAAAGVRQWIAAENARRLHADNITVYVDGVWAANVTGTYEDYVPYLSACPDGVDVMLLQDSNELTLDVALALTASQLRPRAVLGINPSNVNIANAPAAAAGWTLALSTLSIGSASTLGNVGGKFGSLTDARYGIYYWTAGAGTTVVAPDVSYLYYAAIDVLLATFQPVRLTRSSRATCRPAVAQRPLVHPRTTRFRLVQRRQRCTADAHRSGAVQRQPVARHTLLSSHLSVGMAARQRQARPYPVHHVWPGRGQSAGCGVPARGVQHELRAA